MINTDALVQAAQNESPGVDSVIALLNAYHDALNAELANDPAAQAVVDQVTQQLLGNAQKIADAMAANPTP